MVDKEAMRDFNPKEFEALYQRYPRKEGKKRGMGRLAVTIKTWAEFKAFETAMDAYIRMCLDENREPRYIKHWATFVNNWTDYLTKEIATHKTAKEARIHSQVDRILRGEI